MIIIKQENGSASLSRSGDKDKAEYDLKHELISAQIQLDESTKKIDQLKDEINELQKQIVKLEAKAERQND